jgi:hypothetical protein
VDRGKPGSKTDAMSQQGCIPLTVVVFAANGNDHRELETMVDAATPDAVFYGGDIVSLASVDHPRERVRRRE